MSDDRLSRALARAREAAEHHKTIERILRAALAPEESAPAPVDKVRGAARALCDAAFDACAHNLPRTDTRLYEAAKACHLALYAAPVAAPPAGDEREREIRSRHSQKRYLGDQATYDAMCDVLRLLDAARDEIADLERCRREDALSIASLNAQGDAVRAECTRLRAAKAKSEDMLTLLDDALRRSNMLLIGVFDEKPQQRYARNTDLLNEVRRRREGIAAAESAPAEKEETP